MATVTSNASGNWATGATWVGGTKPADGDTVVIAAGHNILMDEDMSGYTTGVGTVSITGGVTPGMLYWKDGTDGYLKVKTGTWVTGTLSTNRGRLLVNSDGVWDNTGSLSISNYAIIDLLGTSYLSCTNMDIQMHCQDPTYRATIVYGTKYDVTCSTDVTLGTNYIDFGTTPPANGTTVALKASSGSTLPGGLLEDCRYYINGVSGNTARLALRNAAADVPDITDVGTGTFSVLTGVTSGATVFNTYDDLSADSKWMTTTNLNNVGVSNTLAADSVRDVDFGTITSIGANTITITPGIAATFFGGAHMVLISRNVQIFTHQTSTSTSAYVIYDPNNADNFVHASIHNPTALGSYGIYSPNNFTFRGVLSNLYASAYAGGTNLFEEFVMLRSTLGLRTMSKTVLKNGIVEGCYYPFYNSSDTYIENCKMRNCVYGTYQNIGITFDADCYFTGGYIGLAYSAGIEMFGDIRGMLYGTYCAGFNLYGDIYGCVNYGLYNGNGSVYGSRLYSNTYDIYPARGGLNMYGVSMESTLIDNGLTTYEMDYPSTLHVSYDHDGEEGHIRSWNSGENYTLTEAAPASPPVTLGYAYKTTAYTLQTVAAGDNPSWVWIPIQVEKGKLLRFKIYEICNSTPSTFSDEGPRWQIVDPSADFGIDNGVLAEVTAEVDGADDTSWHTLNLEYRPIASRMVFLRAIAHDTTGKYFHWMYELQNASSYALQFRGV